MPMQDVVYAMVEWKTRSRHYRLFRDYYDGRHHLKFATQAWNATYGPLVIGLRENLCPATVTAFTDRMQITSWAGADLDNATIRSLSRLVSMVNREAFRCGDAYALVWDGGDGPRAHYHRADQIVPHVDPLNPDVLDWAAKVWQEPGKHGRMNIYYPDRVERWVTSMKVSLDDVETWPPDQSGWGPYTGDGDGDTIPHQFGAVPVCWAKRDPDDQSGYGRSVLTDVIPIQDALNKSVADLVVSSENYADPFWYLLNFKPEIKIDPATGRPRPPEKFDKSAQRIFTTDAEGPMGQLDPPDLTRLLKIQDGYAAKVARVVGIPAYYFSQVSGDVPSGESLRVLSSRITASVSDYEAMSDPVWHGLMALLGQPEAWPQWADPALTSETELLQNAVTKRRDLGYALADVVDDLGEPDPTGIVQRAQEAADQTASRTARTWAQGNLLNG